jgi:hypothetical protein
MKGFVGFLLAAGSAAALVGMANAQPVGGGGPRAILFDQPNFQGRSVTIVEGSPDLATWGFAARAMSARFEGEWTVCEAPELDGRCATLSGDVADLTQTGLRGVVSLGEGATESGRASVATTGASERANPNGDAGAKDEQTADAASGGRNGAFGPPPPPAPPQAAEPHPSAAPPAEAQAAEAPPPPAATPAASAHAQLTLAGNAEATASGDAQAAPSGAGRSAVFFANPTRGGAKVGVDVQGPANQFCREQGLGPAVYFDTDGRVLRDVLCRRS